MSKKTCDLHNRGQICGKKVEMNGNVICGGSLRSLRGRRRVRDGVGGEAGVRAVVLRSAVERERVPPPSPPPFGEGDVGDGNPANGSLVN